MALFSIANRTSNVTTAAANQEVIAAAAVGYRLMELGFTQVTATATVLAFGPPGAIGVGPTSPQTVLAEDQNNATAGNTTTALAWGTTAPTVATNWNRRVAMPATIGAGFIWTFPRGFTITKAKTCVLWNILGGATLDTWVVVDE